MPNEIKGNIPVQMEMENNAIPKIERNKYADKLNKKKRKMPKPLKIIIFVAVIGGIVIGTVKLMDKMKVSSEQTEISQQTTFAMRGMLETFVEGSGRTSAKVSEEIGSDLKGEITEVLVQSGDTVYVGDTLFVVNPTDTREELDTAKEDLDDLMISVDDAAKAVSDANENVSNLNIKAPFTGKFIPNTEDNTTKYKTGETLSSGTVLGTLVDDTTLLLPLYFSYAYIDAINVGDKADVSIPSNMTNLIGEVSSVEKIQKVSDDGVMLFRVIIKITNPGALKNEMIATASISKSDEIIMPSDFGKLEYSKEEQIVSEVSGEIVDASKIDYYNFTQGQTICKLQNEDLYDQIKTAERSLKSANDILADKQKRIVELEDLIANSTVTSPIDGIITYMSAVEGDTLDGSFAPCTVADLTSIVVKIDISELDINKVAVGMPVTMESHYEESQMYFGTVSTVSLQASQSQDGGIPSFPATIQLEMADGVLPDRSVSYRITSATSMDCIMVPSSAVVYTETGAAVYAKPMEGQTFDNALPNPEGSTVPPEFVLVSVETGIFDETNIEILSGLDEGTEVYLAGPQDAYAQFNMGMTEEAVAVG